MKTVNICIPCVYHAWPLKENRPRCADLIWECDELRVDPHDGEDIFPITVECDDLFTINGHTFTGGDLMVIFC